MEKLTLKFTLEMATGDKDKWADHRKTVFSYTRTVSVSLTTKTISFSPSAKNIFQVWGSKAKSARIIKHTKEST